MVVELRKKRNFCVFALFVKLFQLFAAMREGRKINVQIIF